MKNISSFFHSFIGSLVHSLAHWSIGRIGRIGDFLVSHWWKVVVAIVAVEAVGAAVWWWKPAVTGLFTPKKPPVTYAFTSAPKDTGFALLSDNTKSGGFRVLLANRTEPDKPAVRFEVDKSWLAFSLAGVQAGKPFEKRGEKGKDMIVWKEVLPDTDARYQVVDTGLKEDIIFKSDFLAQRAIEDKDRLSVTFDLTTFNVIPRRGIDGKYSLVFADATSGEYRFHMEAPYVVDAAGARFDAINYTLEPVAVAQSTKKSALADSLTGYGPNAVAPDLSKQSIPKNDYFVKRGVGNYSPFSKIASIVALTRSDLVA